MTDDIRAAMERLNNLKTARGSVQCARVYGIELDELDDDEFFDLNAAIAEDRKTLADAFVAMHEASDDPIGDAIKWEREQCALTVEQTEEVSGYHWKGEDSVWSSDAEATISQAAENIRKRTALGITTETTK